MAPPVGEFTQLDRVSFGRSVGRTVGRTVGRDTSPKVFSAGLDLLLVLEMVVFLRRTT